MPRKRKLVQRVFPSSLTHSYGKWAEDTEEATRYMAAMMGFNRDTGVREVRRAKGAMKIFQSTGEWPAKRNTEFGYERIIKFVETQSRRRLKAYVRERNRSDARLIKSPLNNGYIAPADAPNWVHAACDILIHFESIRRYFDMMKEFESYPKCNPSGDGWKHYASIMQQPLALAGFVGYRFARMELDKYERDAAIGAGPVSGGKKSVEVRWGSKDVRDKRKARWQAAVNQLCLEDGELFGVACAIVGKRQSPRVSWTTIRDNVTNPRSKKKKTKKTQ